MKLQEFDYELPKELIAQYPQLPRDHCRLMVVNRKKGTIAHKKFSQIIQYLDSQDAMILNDTRVLSCRLFGRKLSGGKVDILLLEKINDTDFSVLLRPAGLKVNQRIIFNQDRLEAEVIAKGVVRFNTKDTDLIYSKGMMPLPPYIKRAPQEEDNLYYQTVFARRPGAVASPTAGLHFTEALISQVEDKGIVLAYLTLEVNYATFNPVKTEDILKHKMYSEYFEINQSVFSLIKKTKLAGRRVVAVGTTSCRALETVADFLDDPLVSHRGYQGRTELFIYPGYQFKIADSLLTNFHLPRTTLFILVCAFAGRDLIMQAYQEAITAGYRFYSYGDAMLIV